MNYQDKIEFKLNNLQKDFFRLFRKSFPELISLIKIEKGIIQEDNFCFSVNSISEVFGKLFFDIDDTEVTVFSHYDHRHFATYYFDEEKNKQKQILLTCIEAVDYIKDFINGNIIIEYEEENGKILRTLQYHKDEKAFAFSSTINLEEENKEVKDNFILSKLKNLFKIKSSKTKTSIITKRVNWYGEVD